MWACVCMPTCLCVCVSVCMSVYGTQSTWYSQSSAWVVSMSVCLSVRPSVCLCVSLSVCVCVSVTVWVPVFVCAYVSVLVCAPMSVSVYVSVPMSVYVCLCLCVYVCLWVPVLSVHTSLCLCVLPCLLVPVSVGMHVSVPVSVCMSVWVSVCLSVCAVWSAMSMVICTQRSSYLPQSLQRIFMMKPKMQRTRTRLAVGWVKLLIGCCRWSPGSVSSSDDLCSYCALFAVVKQITCKLLVCSSANYRVVMIVFSDTYSQHLVLTGLISVDYVTWSRGIWPYFADASCFPVTENYSIMSSEVMWALNTRTCYGVLLMV